MIYLVMSKDIGFNYCSTEVTAKHSCSPYYESQNSPMGLACFTGEHCNSGPDDLIVSLKTELFHYRIWSQFIGDTDQFTSELFVDVIYHRCHEKSTRDIENVLTSQEGSCLFVREKNNGGTHYTVH